MSLKEVRTKIVDFLLGKKLDCGSRSSDWIDHLQHTAPECQRRLRASILEDELRAAKRKGKS